MTKEIEHLTHLLAVMKEGLIMEKITFKEKEQQIRDDMNRIQQSIDLKLLMEK